MASLAEQMQGLQGTLAALTQRLDAEPQSRVQHRVLSVATPQGPAAEQALLECGTVLTSEQVEDLNSSSGVITIADWLRLRTDAGRSSFRKISNLFVRELKKAKLEQAAEEDRITALGNAIFFWCACTPLFIMCICSSSLPSRSKHALSSCATARPARE